MTVQEEPLPTGPTPLPATLPAQLQAVSQLLDVLERRSQGIIQQVMGVIAQASSVLETNNNFSKAIHPAYDSVRTEPASEPVVRRKHRAKPLTSSSPPESSSPSLDFPSSDSSSSFRESSPCKKKVKGKLKTKETRECSSPFVAEITNTKIPKALEKPPQLTMCTEKGDLDEHIDMFDLILDYRDASDNVSCKLFPLFLSKSALKLYWELPSGSIKPWAQFTEQFPARFAASRVKPKSVDMLQGVQQGEKESSLEYLEMYNQIVDTCRKTSGSYSCDMDSEKELFSDRRSRSTSPRPWKAS